MPEVFLDYKATVPSNMTGGVAAVPIPGPPGMEVANLGMFIVPPIVAPNRVELKGTVAIRALTGTPLVVLRIFRLPNATAPGIEIFSKEQTMEPAPAEGFYTLSFLMIDFDVTATTGFIEYVTTVEISNPVGNTANVVGPVTFTGLAVGNLD